VPSVKIYGMRRTINLMSIFPKYDGTEWTGKGYSSRLKTIVKLLTLSNRNFNVDEYGLNSLTFVSPKLSNKKSDIVNFKIENKITLKMNFTQS